MKKREHSFSRDGLTYDCLASVMSGVSRLRSERQQWFVTVQGIEHGALQYTGLEFTSMEHRRAFEQAVVSLVQDRLDNPL